MRKKDIIKRHKEAEKELRFAQRYLLQTAMLSTIQKDINVEVRMLKYHCEKRNENQDFHSRQIKIREINLKQLKMKYKLYQRGLAYITKSVDFKLPRKFQYLLVVPE